MTDSPFLRKAAAAVRQISRAAHRLRAARVDFHQHPAVMANSVPKSGTHLLTQILAAFPGVREYGTFWASTPSLTYRQRPVEQVLRMVGRTVPGELIGAHLFHEAETARAISQEGVVHFFIYRDPRDVAVSEALYLTRMNRWHRLHGRFSRLPDDSARVRLAITGDAVCGQSRGPAYENLGARFSRYRGWLEEPDVFSVQFEKIAGPERQETIRRMVAHYLERIGGGDIDAVTEAALANIDPSRSHTFRKGRVGGWQDQFNEEHRELVKKYAGALLIDLGYEADLEW